MQVKQYRIDQLLHTIKTFGTSFTPDEGSVLYLSNEKGVHNAFSIPVEGGMPRQVTFSTEHVRHVSIGRSDSRVFYTRDQGSYENTHLFVAEADGTQTLLTPGERVQVRFMGWNPDNTAFYCTTNERDPRFFDLYRIQAKNYARECLYRDTEGIHFCVMSKNEKWAAFIRIKSGTDSDIVLYDLETRVMRQVATHSGSVFFQPACFSADSSSLYFLTDQGAEFSYVCRYEIGTRKTEVIEEGPYNILQLRFSSNSKYAILLVDSDASSKLIVKDCLSGQPIPLPEFDDFSVTSVVISESERLMACFVEGDCSPATLFLYDFESRRLSKLIGGHRGEIDPKDLVKSDRIRFKSRDGLEIPGLLWKPKFAHASHKVPGLVWVHGGPGGQMRKCYSARIQFMVNHGYAVLGVNHRGSSGYGKTFYGADELRQGREPLWDCVDAKNYLASLDYVKPSSIGIIGGSFGGYMVLAALAFEPREFAAGVDICGISNWLRAFEMLPPYWHTLQRKILYQKVGDPQRHQEMLRAISPLFHAEKIVSPLMVLQGAKDPRVLRCEADDIVEAVRRRGGVVEYLVFEDEAHALRRGANAVKAYTAILEFLDRHLNRH